MSRRRRRRAGPGSRVLGSALLAVLVAAGPATAAGGVGTTDRNLGKAIAVVSLFPRRGPIRFTTRSSGTHVLVIGPTCYNATDGPYRLVVTVRHKA
jgi:hypothetical protein